MIEIRRAVPNDAKGIIDVNLRTWRTTYSGIVDDAFLDEREAKREERILQTQASISKAIEEGVRINRFVALEADRVVGFITYGTLRDEDLPDLRNTGEIYALYVLKEYQHMGIGKKLIHYSVQDLMEDQYTSVVIWALKDNPSTAFYRKINGADRFSKKAILGNREYEEIGFFYNDIKSLYKTTA